MDDAYYMQKAVWEAEMALKEGEVPVGAVIVKGDRIIGKGHNRTEALKDPTAHAEIIAIGAAASYLDNWRLNGCKLYVTSEPCVMCAGAIVLARIEEVVFALPEPKFGAVVSLYNVFDDKRLNHRVQYRQGPLEEQVKALMGSFFKEKRQKGPL